MVTPSAVRSVFADCESNVRTYCRGWPTVFHTASGAWLTDTTGRRYLDFFAGAGALNYGHNPPALRTALIDHLLGDGVVHGLDTHTTAKAGFLWAFREIVLRPRGLDHRVQFTGPTGAASVEAALKLARKATGRSRVVGFTGGFHGTTLGALSVNGNAATRRTAGIPLPHGVSAPYDDPASPLDLDRVERLISARGAAAPAAVVVETVQGEGGLTPARGEWLRSVASLCRGNGTLLVVDDIQMGVGRTGPFFSAEDAGVRADVVCVSKSISGYGLPMALTLIAPEHDVWDPGEDSGTFRGNGAAFVTATAALERFWRDGHLERRARATGERLRQGLTALANTSPAPARVVGRGMARGIRLDRPGLARATCSEAFSRGLLVETCGPASEVVKVFPPLTIGEDDLETGLEILRDALDAARSAHTDGH